MTLVVKAAGAADLLAMIPALVGFPPRNSIVLLAFRGKRTCGALRVDLPPADSPSAHTRLASHLVGTLCKIPGADAVVVVVFTDESFDGSASRPWADLAHLFGQRIRQTGFELRDSLCVAADGWASYGDRRVPPGGHPLSEIAESAVAARIPAALRGASSSPLTRRRVEDADPAVMKRVATQLAEYRRVLLEVEGRLQSESGPDDEADRIVVTAGLAPLTDLPALAEEALLWDAAAIDAHGALLLLAVQGPPVRDTVMLQWATSLAIGVRLWDETENAGPDGLGFDPDLADLMLGVGPQPDPERIERGISLMLELVSRAADAERCAPLCMLGWLNWALGRGSAAGGYVAEARAIDPAYSMAELLETMLLNGVLPEWAFAGAA